ncbi:MAG: pyridoxine 5'-phosphate synthase [Deltaproteobacteria bacterium CG11_big_fil_rev_8_21_14_0_20_47_16]|nr:MAG: pyridoxine 5'-phosphate synthase [Deltaproteobacteria bacterium CG11_big_fil_rev_8_21_14_0_20_47_16]
MNPLLGVNIDHIATLRQARGTRYPDPVAAAAMAEEAGADQITIHLREDRRHIQDADVRLLRKTVMTQLNLEMALADEIIEIALETRPDVVTFVPERREEVTTEGGLNIVKAAKQLSAIIPKFKENSIVVSLFLEPDTLAISRAKELGAQTIEIHTGRYAELAPTERTDEITRIKAAAAHIKSLGMRVVAGHGLNYENLRTLVREVPEIEEYNIGHSIIARASFVGLAQAVREMKQLLEPLPTGVSL